MAPLPPPPDPQSAGPSTGGTGAGTAGVRPVAILSGTVLPARSGARITVQRLTGGRWGAVSTALVRRDGTYRAPLSARGLYRVRYDGDAGATVRVR